MRMMHLKTAAHAPSGDPITGRVVLLGNADVEMSLCVPAEPMKYHFKNGQGDECLFIHFGTGTLHTTFGTLVFGPKDYIIIPKGTIYKMEFDSAPPDGPANRFVCFETCNTSHILPPKRYLSKKTSQFLEHAPYCERDLRLPQLPLTVDEAGDFEVRIKARDSVHQYTYDYHPLDVVGWDGCYYPYCFNIDDFSPIVGKHHMPPPTHQTFEGHNFVICSFCPCGLCSCPPRSTALHRSQGCCGCTAPRSLQDGSQAREGRTNKSRSCALRRSGVWAVACGASRRWARSRRC